jgi:transcriptional regulator with XRE-family HTH domain
MVKRRLKMAADKDRGRRSSPGSFGSRLLIARRSKNLTQTELGAKLSVTPQSVSQWEKNQARPTYDKLKALAGILNLHVAELLADPPADPAELAVRTTQLTRKIVDVTRTSDVAVKTKSVKSLMPRTLVQIGEIHEFDLKPNMTSLSEVPEFRSWPLPPHLFAHTRSPPDVRIMRCTQDTLAPQFAIGDHVFIDGSANSIVGTRGFYIMSDGFAVLIRQVEPVAQKDGDELSYRLSSPNPEVPAREVKATNLRILGRIIGKVTMY